ncbi:MAG: hypothetical protein P1V97_15555 [Planctomycetota bacterium]|nr:hypothetical protein [Planctomycetota bacterium]
MRVSCLSIVLVICLGFVSSAHAQGQSVQGPHYRLYYEGSRLEADATLKLLERAYDGYKAFFQKAPTLKEGQRLRVCFYKDRAAWEAGIAADGTKAPAAGGYYWPPSKTAYLFKQPTLAYTRKLILHEAAHQFHYLSRTNNKNPKANWYIEGVAEHLAEHYWDGKTLVLGVPALSLKDYPKLALDSLKAGKITLKSMIKGQDNRALGALFIRYLCTEKKLAKAYKKLAVALDAGAESEAACAKYLGKIDDLEKRFLKWLEDAQQDWTYVYNEWEQLAKDRFYGHAGVVSFCRLTKPAKKLEAKLEAPVGGRWQAGLLLAYSGSGGEYTVALMNHKGLLLVNQRKDGKWTRIGEKQFQKPRPGDKIAMSVSRKGSKVQLTVQGKKVGSFKLAGPYFGLVLDSSKPRFSCVRWR